VREMDLISIIIGVFIGMLIAIVFLLRAKKIIIQTPESDYKVLALIDPSGKIAILKNAKMQQDKIVGLQICTIDGKLTEKEAYYDWIADAHPSDFVISEEDGFGYIVVGFAGNTISPILEKSNIVDLIKNKKLVSTLTETIIKLQSFKLSAFNKFFEEYKKLRDALFNEDIVKHIRATGALCAKMPELLDTFAEGYIVAKLNLNEEDVEQKEELLGWLEDPQTVMKAFATLVAEELYKKIASGGGEKK